MPNQPEMVEPQLAELLDCKAARRNLPAYKVASRDEVAGRLSDFFRTELPAATVREIARMAGGASKEQFTFRLDNAGHFDGKYVLRMDPLESLVETDRRREFEALRAMQGVVPVPEATWLDSTGERLGRPSMIMRFSGGVAAPTVNMGNGNVSGTGALFNDKLRAALSDEFIAHLVAIHNFDWRSADLPSYSVPGDPREAARWRIGWCRRVWQEDKVGSAPVVALALRWLDDNIPPCREPVFVHGDYRTGNYLFDEATGKVTAVLDWELCSIGDFHSDLAWAIHRVCGSSDGKRFLCCGLMPRDELILRYEAASGRMADATTLHFYEVLLAMQIFCMVGATGLSVAKAAHSHQDVLLNWSGGVQHVLLGELCRMLSDGPQQIDRSGRPS